VFETLQAKAESGAAAATPQPPRFRLAVGNKCYSSWSLRAWLAVRAVAGGAGFEEVVCPLAGAGAPAAERAAARARILPFSPSGQLPALLDRDIGETIHESLAIILHLALAIPEARLLPSEPQARARVLWACAELHGGGFSAIRSHMPMNTNIVARAAGAAALARSDVRADIDRLCQVICALRALPCVAQPAPAVSRFPAAHCPLPAPHQPPPRARPPTPCGCPRPMLRRHAKRGGVGARQRDADAALTETLCAYSTSSKGPYLCGEDFTAADCMYAPIALRFRTYDPGGIMILIQRKRWCG